MVHFVVQLCYLRHFVVQRARARLLICECARAPLCRTCQLVSQHRVSVQTLHVTWDVGVLVLAVSCAILVGFKQMMQFWKALDVVS